MFFCTSRKVVPLGMLFVFSILPSHLYAQDTEVAKVIVVEGSAYAMNGGNKRDLTRRSPVYEGDIIHTEAGSKVQLRFIDDALLSLKEKSEFKVEEYKYDTFNPESNTSSMNLVQGGFWTVTGQIADISKDAYSVSTNFTTIGVRGTFYGVAVKQKKEILKSDIEKQNNAKSNNISPSKTSKLLLNNDGYSAGENTAAPVDTQDVPDEQSQEEQTQEEQNNDNGGGAGNISEVFAVLDGAIEVTNSFTQETISMTISNNQFVELASQNSDFVELTNIPNGLSDTTNNPAGGTSGSSNQSQSSNTGNSNSSMATNDSKTSIDTSANSKTLPSTNNDDSLLFNNVRDLITPAIVSTPASDDTVSQVVTNATTSSSTSTSSSATADPIPLVANAGTVALSASELNQVTGFGIAIMTAGGRNLVAGLAGPLSAGNPVVLNSNRLTNVTSALSIGTAPQFNCDNNGSFCTTTIPDDTNNRVRYGSWSANTSQQALLRDGLTRTNLSDRVLWQTSDTGLISSARIGEILNLDNLNPTVTYNTISYVHSPNQFADITDDFSFSMPVNYSLLNTLVNLNGLTPVTATATVNITEVIGGNNGVWNGTFTATYSDNKFTASNFGNMTFQLGTQPTQTVSGNFALGIVGNGQGAMGGISWITPTNRTLQALFGVSGTLPQQIF